MSEQPGWVPSEGRRLLIGLRTFGANYTEFTRQFARHLGLHATDAVALVEILYAEDQGVPLSPARLGDRVALSSGATTALINRLEEAGHVIRSREHTDRRIVTLRSSPDIEGPARDFFGPLGQGLDRLSAGYDPDTLTTFNAFLDELRTMMDDLLGSGAAPTPSEGSAATRRDPQREVRRPLADRELPAGD